MYLQVICTLWLFDPKKAAVDGYKLTNTALTGCAPMDGTRYFADDHIMAPKPETIVMLL